MDIQEFRSKFSPIFNNIIENHLENFNSIAEDSFLISLAEHTALLAKNGKLLRPYLAYLGYLMGRGNNEHLVMKLGVGLELFHVFCLIHDDVIDKADTRRNILTIEEFTKIKLQTTDRRGDIPYIAKSQAILFGDLFFSWAAQEINESTNLSNTTKIVTAEFYNMVNEVVAGQMIDVDTMSRNEQNEKLIEKKMYLKTASYSFIRPLRLGYLLTGSSNINDLRILDSIGKPLGLAFQLQDDLFDITSKAETLGKPILSDLQSGQQTYLTAFVEKNGQTHEKELLNKVINGSGTKKDLNNLREVFIQNGAVASTTNRLNELWHEAETNLQQSKLSNELTSAFLNIIETIKSRNS